MRAIEVSGVEEGDTAIVGVPNQRDKRLLAHAGMIGLAHPAAHAGTDTDKRRLDARFTQRYLFHRRPLWGLLLRIGNTFE